MGEHIFVCLLRSDSSAIPDYNIYWGLIFQIDVLFTGEWESTASEDVVNVGGTGGNRRW